MTMFEIGFIDGMLFLFIIFIIYFIYHILTIKKK
jgi:hypothetical protein